MLNVEKVLRDHGYGDWVTRRGFSSGALRELQADWRLAIAGLLLAFVANGQELKVRDALLAFARLNEDVEPESGEHDGQYVFTASRGGPYTADITGLGCDCPEYQGRPGAGPVMRGMCRHLMYAVIRYGVEQLDLETMLKVHGYQHLLTAFPDTGNAFRRLEETAKPMMLSLFAAFIIHFRHEAVAELVKALNRGNPRSEIHRVGDTQYYRVALGSGHNLHLERPGCDCADFATCGWCEGMTEVLAWLPVLLVA